MSPEEIYIEAVKMRMEITASSAAMRMQIERVKLEALIAKTQIEAQLVAGAMGAMGEMATPIPFPAFHPGLDVREMSRKIGELSASGKSAEEIAKEIDPNEFDGRLQIRPWRKWGLRGDDPR